MSLKKHNRYGYYLEDYQVSEISNDYRKLYTQFAKAVMFEKKGHGVAYLGHDSGHYQIMINPAFNKMFLLLFSKRKVPDRALNILGILVFWTWFPLLGLKRCHLRSISPVVQQLYMQCKKHNLPYRSLSFLQANIVTIQTLTTAAMEARGLSLPVPKNMLWEAINIVLLYILENVLNSIRIS
ncbi:hypothetical protein ACS0TY_020159 [Phlomoides rotata]